MTRFKSDTTYMFRSYNHTARFPTKNPRELNPGTLLTGDGPRIWEACRASAAAPLFFKEMVIDSLTYMDGGVGNNNPSDLAWNEAKYMANKKEPLNGKVLGLVSLGTGQAHPESRFGMMNLWKWTRKTITETSRAHGHVHDRAMDAGAKYWRFDVRPDDKYRDGLAGIKLDECKRTRRKKKKNKELTESPTSSLTGDADWHENLQLEAMEEDHKLRKLQDSNMPRNKGYNPVKYEYTTFDEIFKRTEHYCMSCQYEEGTNREVKDVIDDCAEFLLKVARNRWKKNRTQFRRFVSHPNPKHADYLPPLTAFYQNEVQGAGDNEDDDGRIRVEVETHFVA